MFNSTNPWGYSWRNERGELGASGNRKPYVGDPVPYQTCECPYVGCGAEVQRKGNGLDKHIAQCLYRPMRCPWCAEELTYLVMTRTHRNTCPKRPTPCPNGCVGRTGEVMILPFDAIATHRRVCWSEVVDCQHPTCFIRRTRREIRDHEANDHYHDRHVIKSVRRSSVNRENVLSQSQRRRMTKMLGEQARGETRTHAAELEEHLTWLKLGDGQPHPAEAAAAPAETVVPYHKKTDEDYVKELKEEFAYSRNPTENNGRLFRYTRPPPRPLNRPETPPLPS